MWGHHPAFGAPFLEEGCRIETSAQTFTADDRAPGGELDPGRSSVWPQAALAERGAIDLSVVPRAEEPRAVLGYLSDFVDGSYRIVNPRLGLAVELRWPLELFPTAWFWQELRAQSRLSVVPARLHHGDRAEHDNARAGHRQRPDPRRGTAASRAG